MGFALKVSLTSYIELIKQNARWHHKRPRAHDFFVAVDYSKFAVSGLSSWFCLGMYKEKGKCTSFVRYIKGNPKKIVLLFFLEIDIVCCGETFRLLFFY